MNAIFPVTIRPSQLSSFKEKAESFADIIASTTGSKTLSAFKRNDYLSMGVGYKGHTDLIKSAKFRACGDNHQPLYLFQSDILRTSIVEVFASKLPKLEVSAISKAAYLMAESELKDNTDSSSRLPMVVDELLAGDDLGKFRTFVDKVNAAATRKNAVPVLTLNFSEMPTNVYKQLMSHPAVIGFDVDATRNDVVVKKLTPSSDTTKSDGKWKIRISFDTWGASEIPFDVLNDWYTFRNWLMLYNDTGRVQIAERLNDHKMITYHTQPQPSLTIEKLAQQLPSDHDRYLLYVLLNPTKTLVMDESLPLLQCGAVSDYRYSSEFIHRLTSQMVGDKKSVQNE